MNPDKITGVCDKCNESVLAKDDVSLVEAAGEDSALAALIYLPRHIKCSPSRAQFIMCEGFGEPDSRPQYDKRNMGVADRERQETRMTANYLRHCIDMGLGAKVLG